MPAFTIAHVSLVALRYKHRDEELAFRGRPNLRLGGVDWPLFALVGAVGTGLAWIVVVVQTPSTRYAGFLWLALGFAVYVLYRKRVVHEPLRATVRAPAAFGPALALEYRRPLGPVRPGSAVARRAACGIETVGRLERPRSAAPPIVAEAEARDAEIIVLGSPRRTLTAT